MSVETTPAAEPEGLPLSQVERELSRQMDAAKEPGESPVQRAHMSNLVIFTDRAETVARMNETIPGVVMLHPARVLLLVGLSGDGKDEIRGQVSVWCQRHRGGPKACCEQVTLHARGSAVERLPFATRGLVIGDLPTNIWWAVTQPPSLGGPLLHGLAEYAQQVIYDSIGWPDPARGVAATASWIERFESAPRDGRWHVASDLNWRRLKYWRRLLAQALDPNTAPDAIASITEVLVEHGPHAVVQALLLVSWLASRLGWKVEGSRVQPGVETAWKAAAAHGALRLRLRRLPEGPSEIRKVRIACAAAGKTSAFDFQVESEQRLAVVLEGESAAARTMTIPAQPLSELVARQLSDRERDPVFRESIAVAQTFARSVIGS
jgi:glucose-6-phosphate dehydrogenase assembly protein OpcA